MRVDHLRREYVLSVLRESGPMDLDELGEETGLDDELLYRSLTLLADEDEVTVGSDWELMVASEENDE